MIQNMVLSYSGGGGSTDWNITHCNSIASDQMFFPVESEPKEFIIYISGSESTDDTTTYHICSIIYTNNYKVICSYRRGYYDTEYQVEDANAHITHTEYISEWTEPSFLVMFDSSYIPVSNNQGYYMIYR